MTLTVDVNYPDRQQLCPMFASACLMSGKRLLLRSPETSLELRVPANLLEQAFHLCDGTRTLAEILASIVRPKERRVFADFLNFLLAQEVLIDARQYTNHAARYAYQSNPYGRSLNPEFASRIVPTIDDSACATHANPEVVRHSPLGKFFEQRISSYTFDNQTIQVPALISLLWALHGVVHAPHERLGEKALRHTHGSAGALHLLQIYVALRRAVGLYPPGIYRVEYPAAHQVRLAPISTEIDLLPRAFIKPWHLTYAVGSVFVIGDPQRAALRYRNRALQYQFMEAGAALQNAALSAAPLGLGLVVIGGYDESTVERLCHLQNKRVLGAGIFGVLPTATQRKQIRRMPNFNFTWVNDTRVDAPSIHLARMDPLDPSDAASAYAWGAHPDPWLAYTKSAAEAIERLGFRQPKALEIGRITDWSDALDPRVLLTYTREQYAQAGFPYHRFNPRRNYLWLVAKEYATKQTHHLLAEFVHPRNVLRAMLPKAVPYTQATTSGCAAGLNLREALWRGLLETVERDAFMRHWLRQRAGIGIRIDSLPETVRVRVQKLQALGCRIQVQCLNSPWACVMLVSAQHPTLHFTTLGSAARLHAQEALLAALNELEARVLAWLSQPASTTIRVAAVRTATDHFQLYGVKSAYQRANRVLFCQAQTNFLEIEKSLRHFTQMKFIDFYAQFLKQGITPLYVDITPQLHHLNQGRTSLVVVKTFVPSLLPLSFGVGLEPRGMLDKVHPGSFFPHPFP